MKFKNNSLKDETNSLTMTSTESRSMLLGEEASSNRLDLFYENQKNLLKAQFEQEKKLQNEIRKSSEPKETIAKKSNFLPKTAPARLEKQIVENSRPNLLKEVSALNLSSVRNSSIRFSAREKIIMDWAFKRFDDETFKPKIQKKRKKNRFDHEFWFEDDPDSIKGAISNSDINLDDDGNQLESNNFDFYRTHRKAVTTKTDIEINRQIKQLDAKLIDLSKERFKVLNILDYEKKKFVRNQLLKSESLPGLRCVALINEKPDYRFKRTAKVTSFEKIHQLSSADFEKTFNLPNINSMHSDSTQQFLSQQTDSIQPKSKIKVESLDNDKRLVRSNTSGVLISSKPTETKSDQLVKIDFNRSKTDNQITNNSFVSKNPNNNLVINDTPKEVSRPKTGVSDKTKLKQTKTDESTKNEKTSKQVNSDNSQESSKSDLTEFKSKSQTNFTQDESTGGKVKSILKQSNGVKINTADQRTIIFDEKSSNSLRVKSAKSAKSTRTSPNKPNERQPNSLDIMVGVVDNTDDLEENESLASVTSFNLADTVITNDVVSNITDQTLAANLKLVNDYMELEDESFLMIMNQNQNESIDDLMDSFIKARAKNVSSLSEPYPKLGEDTDEQLQNLPRSVDDSTINLKSKDTNHKVSFKLTSESNEDTKSVKQNKKNEEKINSETQKPSNKENQKDQKIAFLNRRPKLTTNLPKKSVKNANLIEQSNSNENNLTSEIGNTSILSLTKLNEQNVSYTHIQTFISPIQDNRFTDFISVVKPAYIVKETKDVKKIIEKNDALKSINIDIETREKMNKVKERGSKLAVKARQILASGEYSREFIQ